MPLTRRRFVACLGTATPALALASSFSLAEEDAKMVLLLMFNKAHTEEDEVRFSLFKFKLPRFPRPAWDFQYVLRKLEKGKEYGFKARLVWTKFVSPENCLKEYETWAGSMR